MDQKKKPDPEAVKNIQWHSIAPEQVLAELAVDSVAGLSSEEAASRLSQFGYNVVEEAKRRSLLKMFFAQFLNPLVVVLVVSAAIMLVLGDYIDAGVIGAVVIANSIIGFLQERKAESAIAALSKMLKVQASVFRDGLVTKLEAEHLVPGDILSLQSGDRVPADLRIIQEKGLQTDESALTGESAPVGKKVHPVSASEPVSDRVCMAFSGTLITAGNGKGVVVATGDQTQIGLISRLIVSTPDIVTPLTRKLAKFGVLLSAVILVLSVVLFAVGVLMGNPAADMFKAAVAIAVAMIPEGLPAIVTIILAVGVKRMASRNAVIRSLPSVETLGSVTVICSDKTGTLTTNEMTVRSIHAGGHSYELAGIGYDPTFCCVESVDESDEDLNEAGFIECLKAGVLCNDSGLQQENDRWIPIGDPTEVALITAAHKAGISARELQAKFPRLDVLPFESANMYMATLNATGDGKAVVYVKGSLEKLLDMCGKQIHQHELVDLNPGPILHRSEVLAEQGYRVIAFAMKVVSADIRELHHSDLTDLVYIGIQSMSDPARPEAMKAVEQCKQAGIEVKMITGDHAVTAAAIARDLGIARSNVPAITGMELAQLSESEFIEAAKTRSVFARVAPEQKYHLVEALQGQGEIVAMTGDGVNDAPSLRKADIGVGMGAAGSEVAKDASDMVLTDDNFASIVSAVEEGRTVFENITKTLAYLLPTNLGEGLVIVIALLLQMTMPVTPVQVLWINTVTAITLALPMAFEPMEPGIMKLRPRLPNSPLVDLGMIRRILIVSVVIVLAAFASFLYVQNAGGTIEQARTTAVAAIVACEIFYLFSARVERVPVWKTNVFSNPYVWVGVLLVILLQLAFTYLGTLNYFFGSAPISWQAWSIVVLFSFPVMIIVGIDKALIRNRVLNGID